MAGIALLLESAESRGEVRVAVPDAEVDVPRDGVAQVDVGDPPLVTPEVLERLLAGGHDVAEVHDDSDGGPGEPVGEQFGALEVPAEPEEVQRFGPDFNTEFSCTLPGVDQPGSDSIQVLLKAPDRFVAEGSAGEDQRLGSGAGREGEQRRQVPLTGLLPVGAEDGVEVPDVPVDRTDPESGGRDLSCNECDGGQVQFIGDVVTDTG